MDCLIKGCNFLLKNIPDEVFCYQRHENTEYKFQNFDSERVFPYLLVNIGSGVGLFKVCPRSKHIIIMMNHQSGPEIFQLHAMNLYFQLSKECNILCKNYIYVNCNLIM